MTSPPTCAMGSRTLVASRTNRKSTHVRSRGRVFGAKISHQPAPATATVTPRTTTTKRIPHPTLATAWPTASRPDHAVMAMTAAIPINQAATPACLTISAPIRPKCGRCRTYAGLPGRFDVEGVGCSNSERELVRRAALLDQGRAGRVAVKTFVFDEGMRRELRGPGVTRLGPRADRAHAALGVEQRKARCRRLRRIDAEIRRCRGRTRQGDARPPGEGPLRADRNDRVHEDVGNDPVVPVEALPYFDAGAQPRNHPVFSKHAELDGPRHVAEALQCPVEVLPPRHPELADRSDLENVVPEQADADPVARTAEGFGRAKTADRQDRIGQHEVPLGALEDRLEPGFAADSDGPVGCRRWRGVDARVGIGRGRHKGDQQRGHKTSNRGAPTAHLSPSLSNTREG